MFMILYVKGCALGKNVKNKFPRSHTRSKGILDLVHSDLCGPMSTPSLNGYLYYVLFINDISRKAWIYFMKSKSETFCKFQEFKALVENQTSRHIHALRSDNGGDLNQIPLMIFVVTQGYVDN